MASEQDEENSPEELQDAVSEGTAGAPEENPNAVSEEGASAEEAAAEEGPVGTAGPEIASGDTVLQPCSNCATMLDVGDLEPFAKVHCPICGTAQRVRTQLKNFTLVEVLGAGGMGAVYKALDTNLNRMVALKVVRKEFSADAEYLGKFEREARITASVTHPHVVKVYSFGSDHGLFYIAMELVDKGSLDDLMNLQGRVAEIQAIAVGAQIAQGLQAAHQKGLIHRDVKPGNILFADAQTAKIVDFGLALLAEHEAEERGEVWGTPYYVAPEKLDHQPEDFRSDIYSLGGTLFHAIAGRPPFEADTASMVALKHLKSRPVSLQAFAPDVSSATAYVINRMLLKDPEQRYQSYTELIEHLEYAKAQLQEAVNKPRRPKARVVVESKSQQNVFGVIVLMLILIMAGIGAVLYVDRGGIFGQHAVVGVGGTSTSSNVDPAAAAKQLHDALDDARNKMISGDYDGAMAALKNLDDNTQITQPFQNWITTNEGIDALLQENLNDARDWFRVVQQRAHYSTEASDQPLVTFFDNIGGTMRGSGAVSPATGTNFALDNEEALAPFLFALKDWNLSRFDDAERLFELYLSSTPKDPFEWVDSYKPLAQKFYDSEGTFEKLSAAADAADTPDKRAAVIKQLSDFKAKLTGKFAARVDHLLNNVKQKSAQMDAAYNEKMAAAKTQDVSTLAAARPQYTAAVAAFSFDQALKGMQAINLTTPDAVAERDALVKKLQWLQQFKAGLIKDMNATNYTGQIVTRNGGGVPAGTRKADDTGLTVQTQFGSLPFTWSLLTPAQILAIASDYIKSAPPAQTPDRQWIAGVYACAEGMQNDGRTLLVAAAQAKDAYKDDVSMALQNQ
jgi:eukaryotic-like serine/threonine-protein kinase